jgi:hypothetical protein
MLSMNKSVIWRQCSVLMACVILPAGFAVAQSDGALDITGQLGATTDQSTSPPSMSALDSISDTVEDTPLFSLDTVTTDSETDTDTDTNILSATSRDVPSVSLSNKDPKGVMLATIGINTEARGVLSRTMWQNSMVSDVMALMERLPERVSSPRLDQLLRHVMISRAIPPGGATQNAGIFLEYKLEWMRDQGLSDMLAQFARQLPADENWASWGMFLVNHNLITKNDDELCQKVESLRDMAASPAIDADYLLKNQIFCALLSGEDSLASFQLDLLEERGIEDELFFNVLRARIDGTTADMVAPVLPTGLNIALMDLDNIVIPLDIRQNMPIALSQSLSQLSYLNPETAYYQFGVSQQLRLKPIEEQMMEWPYIPQNAINLSMAITQFADQSGGDKDRFDIASQRIMLWNSLLSTENPVEKLDITLMALEYDMAHIGAESLDIWAPHLAAAITGMTPENERTRIKYNQAIMLLVIADYPLPDDIITGPEHVAWQNLAATVMAGEMPQDMLRDINAQDAIPLLDAVGVVATPLTDEDRFANRPRLASGMVSFAYPDMVMLAQHPARERPAETVLMLAALMQDTPLHALSRDDAATLAGALYDAGLIEESRQFAVEIMRAWGAYRVQISDEDSDEDMNAAQS